LIISFYNGVVFKKQARTICHSCNIPALSCDFLLGNFNQQILIIVAYFTGRRKDSHNRSLKGRSLSVESEQPVQLFLFQ